MKILFSRLLICVIIAAGILAAGSASADNQNASDSHSWAGLYAGVHAGDNWVSINSYGPAVPTSTTNGFIGGGQIGYNWQHDKIVMGVEGDGSALGVNSKSSGFSFKESWMMTLRGRVGYSFGWLLPYATAGLAFTDATESIAAGSNSNINTGAAAGLGLDGMVSNHWIVRLEYLFTNVPRESSTIGTTTVSAGSFNNIIRFGVNYKF